MCRIVYYLYCSTINQSINQSISIYLSFFLSLYLSLSTLFLFTEFVYGIHLIFFQSSCIESLLLRCFRPSRPWERPHVRARRSSFSPRRPRKAERAFRVRIGRNVRLWLKVEDTQRAKRFCFRVSFFQLSFSCVFGCCVFVVEIYTQVTFSSTMYTKILYS